jgi:hypothetical protein
LKLKDPFLYATPGFTSLLHAWSLTDWEQRDELLGFTRCKSAIPSVDAIEGLKLMVLMPRMLVHLPSLADGLRLTL